MISPTLFFFLKIFVAILGLLNFHIIFVIFVLVLKICRWYLEWNCVESIDCFWYYGHFNDVNSSCPWTWYMLPLVCIFFNFFLQCLTNTGLLHPWLNLFLLWTIANGIVFLASLSNSSLLVYKNAAVSWIFILYAANSLIL